ncbi:carbohydrate kinase family protein [Pseudorhodobacter ferrugineus]|uniref:carbohydrate kinase family protein n=1 Tax=Pseudorhodobacter ferrugineus TaxID=77008 RepID=UPI0003B5F3BE|nr:PfkB family carbohydrate kinase [Pseudorhodobacter ferrugineus]
MTIKQGVAPRLRGKRVLCAGRLYCDLVMGGLPTAPIAGQEVYADTLAMTAGGGAYITAAYLVALGREVGLSALIPAEPFAGPIASELAAAGIDLAPCAFAPAGLDPQITVALVMGDDRAFVTRRSGPAVPSDLPDLIAAGGYDHLHIGELATLAEMPDIVARAKAAHMTVSVDCAWDTQVLARGDLVDLLAGADVFLPNRVEAAALARHAPLAAYAPLVVVKNGKNGAEAFAQGHQTHRPALPVKVVDTVGAGDAFNAGFLDRWLDGANLTECLDAGARVASVALARQGGARGVERLARHRAAAE